MFTINQLLSVLAAISVASAAPTCKSWKGAHADAAASASASVTSSNGTSWDSVASSNETSWDSVASSNQTSLESASPSSYESYSAPSASASDAGTPVSAVVQAAAAPTSSASSAVSSSAAESSTEPSSTSSSAAASPSSGGASSGEFSGQATYYEAGLGACGWTNSGSDYIVAMNQAQYSQDVCGKNIVITNPATGQTATAEVVDLCPGCAQGALDMSTGLFSYLNNGNMDAGVFQMEWNYAS